MKIVSTTNEWLFGDFEEAIKRTKSVDVGIKILDKETFVNDPHYHTSSTEYNYILEGKIIIDDNTIIKGSAFIYEPYEISNISKVVENTKILVVRFPSAPNDKVIL